MSHFATELNRLMIEKNMTGADVARAAGLTSPQISRLKNGVQIWIGPEKLKSIASAFTPSKGETDDKIHAGLLHAHLFDECSGAGAKYISIELRTNPSPIMLQKDAEAKPVLPPLMQKNMDIISKHITRDRSVRDLIQIAANLCNGQNPTHESHKPTQKKSRRVTVSSNDPWDNL